MDNTPFAALVDKDWVTLDTETTDLGNTAEVLEISVADGRTGKLLLDSLVKPIGEINPRAQEVHGITKEMVENAPTWDRVALALDIVLKGRVVVIYNANFDIRIMSQSSRIAGLNIDGKFNSEAYFCAMSEYARRARIYNHFHGRNRTFKLQVACELEGVPVPKELHRSAADARLTRDLVKKIIEGLPHEGVL